MPFTIRPYRRSLRIASLRTTLISSEIKHWLGRLAPRLACAVVEMKWLWVPFTALGKRVLVRDRGSCPYCSSTECYRSRRYGDEDLILRLVGMFPWHCESCGKRFHLWKRSGLS